MEIREVAEAFANLLKADRFDEAAIRFWHEDIATYEAMPGDFAEVHGRAANLEKAKWWYDNHHVHETRVDGPWVNGDQFALRMAIDVTPKGGERMQMDEIVLYTVRDGKVAEERYLY
ncbi:MAG: SnoaL-like domain-containing protein [Thermaurantiacus sp.]